MLKPSWPACAKSSSACEAGRAGGPASVDFRAGFGDTPPMRDVTPRQRSPQPPPEALPPEDGKAS
jgi:hypothetical protein